MGGVPLYKMTVAYDGTNYQGWQIQPDADTLQGRLERALSLMSKTEIPVTGAGRTDAGVHALAQVAHFRLPRGIPEAGMVRGLNTLLPGDIRVRDVREAEEGFHARFSACRKTYRYHLDPAPVALPFRCRFAIHHPYPLDREALEKAARTLVGEHDFAALRASSCSAKTTVRNVTTSHWFEEGGELVYEVEASGFLHHMVRNIVGTLLEVGRGKMRPDVFRELIESRDRTRAGPTAPPKGLCLVRVDYGEKSSESHD